MQVSTCFYNYSLDSEGTWFCLLSAAFLNTTAMIVLTLSVKSFRAIAEMPSVCSPVAC